MQSYRWYLHRLQSMSPGELWWRLGGRVGGFADRMLLPLRSGPPLPERILNVPPGDRATAPNVLGAHLPDCRFTPEEADRWQVGLVAQADAIAAHRLDLFDLTDHPLGDRINWNYEYKAKKHAPMRPASSIDYRDYQLTGDCKFVWEPSRHHQWVVLARAYHATQDERYAQAVAEQFDSWIEQCPYGRGMNWRSPLELAIRMINWVWAFALIEGSSAMAPGRYTRMLQAVSQHLFEISRRYSRYSSANNHLIGEAAGVFIAGSFFTGLRSAARLREKSREILIREVLRQTFADGGTREQATGYHLFVLEFLLLAGIVARNAQEDFPPEFWSRIEKMLEFVAGLSDGSDTLPMIGDADDGYVIDLGGRDDAAASLLSVGAVLFSRPDFKARAGSFREPAFWLFGAAGRRRFRGLSADGAGRVLRPLAFPDSGYYLLQRGHAGASDRISVIFDCGDLGFLSIAAHGHADALSVLLRVGGVDVLVDPGTYDYFTFGRWREYFRGTRAHNTVVVDDTDQSEMLGAFLWGRRARCRLVRWEPTQRGGTVAAEHDGYARGSDPVIHRRTVMLRDNDDEVIVRDDIVAHGRHDVAIYWHFSEHCRVEASGGNRFEAAFGAGRLAVTLDPRLAVTKARGAEEPILGWVSRGYHRKSKSVSLVGRCQSDGRVSLETRMAITFGESPRGAEAGEVRAAPLKVHESLG